MTFFESLLALMFAAVLLLQISRRIGLPYPAMLAAAGVVVAFVPGAPTIIFDPTTALALFIAPVLLDAAFDFPAGAAAKLWRPLVALALVAVLATAGVVAWIGWAFAGLPIAAAVVLGAVVAPPDAAAATAVLSNVSLPKRTVAVLKGESLFNDATSLLLFAGALAVQRNGGFDTAVGIQLTIAVPGGVLFGIAAGWLTKRVNRYVAGTLGGTLLQFLNAFAVWIIAEHLHISAVLAVVVCAMTVARSEVAASPRVRVHSFAVWATVVFLLNVLAFLLMGMQARTIVGRMPTERLWEAGTVAGMIVVAVIVTRLGVVLAWNRLSQHYEAVRGPVDPPTTRQGVIVGWAGMRGLVSLATAFALPGDFPQRDLVVLTAFAVVLATLVVQGVTLTPLIRWLKVDELEDPGRELTKARSKISATGRDALKDEDGREAQNIRDTYDLDCGDDTRDRYRALGLDAVRAERAHLQELWNSYKVGEATYQILQEELDWREITLLPDDERKIEEG